MKYVYVIHIGNEIKFAFGKSLTDAFRLRGGLSPIWKEKHKRGEIETLTPTQFALKYGDTDES